MEEVRGSNPLSSTSTEPLADRRRLGFALGGLVAAEGSFFTTRLSPDRSDGTPRQRFVFQLAMAQRDKALVQALRSFLGTGAITDRARRADRWQPTTTLTISGRRSHHSATIPFAEAYLLPCEKRRQFESSREALAAYESVHPSRYGKGPSTCSMPSCERPVRGRGLCRARYYRATGW